MTDLLANQRMLKEAKSFDLPQIRDLEATVLSGHGLIDVFCPHFLVSSLTRMIGSSLPTSLRDSQQW